jgi:prolyl-tRNA editing enzyme YbaK/EbsC (Cys-tRNA(Pro) deacylase)
LIDTDLRDHDQIWASAGTPHAVFATTFDELATLAGAEETVVAQPA